MKKLIEAQLGLNVVKQFGLPKENIKALDIGLDTLQKLKDKLTRYFRLKQLKRGVKNPFLINDELELLELELKIILEMKGVNDGISNS